MEKIRTNPSVTPSEALSAYRSIKPLVVIKMRDSEGSRHNFAIVTVKDASTLNIANIFFKDSNNVIRQTKGLPHFDEVNHIGIYNKSRLYLVRVSPSVEYPNSHIINLDEN